MSTWWATEKAKEALQTGFGLEDLRCTRQRMLHKESETNLCVDLVGNITDGPWGAIIGMIDLRTGLVRNGFGKQTGIVRIGEAPERADAEAHRAAGQCGAKRGERSAGRLAVRHRSRASASYRRRRPARRTGGIAALRVAEPSL